MPQASIMNGSSGSNWQNSPESAEASSKILQALEIIHDPKSANSLRQKATHFLEEVRSDDYAPVNGFAISSNRSHPAIIRHYGLSLIEYAIRHRWDVCAPEKSIQLRKWVVDLAQDILEGDPSYISNKIAELWVEVAKRSWALDWMDMDELLFRLWEGHLARKALVLNILETLSEDVFEREDFTAGLRGTELNRACIESFTPAVILREIFPSRDANMNVRYGEEGWLWRMGALLEWCVQENAATEPQRTCAIQVLHTMKSAFNWLLPAALVKAHSMTRVMNCLGVSAVPVQLVRNLRSCFPGKHLLTDNIGCR